ncbi:MAG: hypothetical protein COB12_12080 [Flavobacterium sp.]|nr:MAG: hypothetical protein COB12_12080 [Flavobacterium sp.]
MKNIFQRMNAVMQEISYVQKDSKISGGGANYKAVSHDQVVSIARAQFVEHGIVVYPEQLNAEMIQQRDLKQDIKMHLYSGMYNIHFVNIDEPADRLSVSINAHAADNGDKAPGKCASYATKTAILKALCLETGENDESRAEAQDTNTITDEQVQELLPFVCGEDGHYTPKGENIRKAFKFVNLTDIKTKKFEAIMAVAKK